MYSQTVDPGNEGFAANWGGQPMLEQTVNTGIVNAAYIPLTVTGTSCTLAVFSTDLGSVLSLTLAQCASFCNSTANCATFNWYQTTPTTCNIGTGLSGSTVVQPFTGAIPTCQGGTTTTVATIDQVPHGVRSSVPLGGLGTGHYELRADGTFHLSTIQNQSPAGEPWQGVIRDFILAVAVNGVPYVVRLQPLGGITNVPSIVYSGQYPVSKLEFLGLSLYAYSTVTPSDNDVSNTPAVVFSLDVNNPTATTMNVTFMIIKSMGFRSNWQHILTSSNTTLCSGCTESACASSCLALGTCYAWQYFPSSSTCVGDIQRYNEGYYSASTDAGNPGTFSATLNSIQFVNRVIGGAVPYSGLGDESLFVPTTSHSIGIASGQTVTDLLGVLSQPNPSVSLSALTPGSLFGAASVSAIGLASGSNTTLDIIHSWYYSHFYFYRQQSNLDLGVRYSKRFNNSIDAARSVNLTQTIVNHYQWQRLWTGLTPLLRDTMMNLFSHARWLYWFYNGEVFVYEDQAFADYDGIVNERERHLAYFWFFPDTERQKLTAMANHALLPTGYLADCFAYSSTSGHGIYTTNCGSDANSQWLVAVYENFLLHNDTRLVVDYYAQILSVFQYLNQWNFTQWRFPYATQSTYDVQSVGFTGSSIYVGAFYLVGLLSVEQMALFMNDQTTADRARSQFIAAQQSIEDRVWVTGQQYYMGDTNIAGFVNSGAAGNLYSNDLNGYPYRMSDALHAQVIAYHLGFGDLFSRRRMKLHTNYVIKEFQTPYGLMLDNRVQTADNRNNFGAHVSWQLSDTTTSALMLRWNEANAWYQWNNLMTYYRDIKSDIFRPTAFINTDSGNYYLLNYYGYAMFGFYTADAYSGQVADLPRRKISFSPHTSAFNNTGQTAILPILLGGNTGLLTINSTTTIMEFLFMDQTLSFVNITICQYSFSNGPYVFIPKTSMFATFIMPGPCDKVSMVPTDTVTRSLCSYTIYPNSMLDNVPTQSNFVASYTQCQDYAMKHHFDSFTWLGTTSTCYVMIGASPAKLVAVAVANQATVGLLTCDYGTPEPNTCSMTTANLTNTNFGPSFSYINSAVYTQPVSTVDRCAALAIQNKACGWLFVDNFNGPAIGACSSATTTCCYLNPYEGCSSGFPLTNMGTATLGFTGCFDPVHPNKMTTTASISLIQGLYESVTGTVGHVNVLNGPTNTVACIPIFNQSSVWANGAITVYSYLNPCQVATQSIVLSSAVRLAASNTQCIWANLKQADSVGISFLFGTSGGNSNGWYGMGVVAGQIYVYYSPTTTGNVAIAITFNTWHHYCLSVNQTKQSWTAYYDGQPVLTVSIAGITYPSPVASNYPLLIGGYSDGGVDVWQGYLMNYHLAASDLGNSGVLSLYQSEFTNPGL